MKVHEDSVDSIEYVCMGCNASYNSTTELQADDGYKAYQSLNQFENIFI